MASSSRNSERAKRKRRILRNRIIFLLICLALLAALIWGTTAAVRLAAKALVPADSLDKIQASSLESDENKEAGEHFSTSEVFVSDASDWRLVLVNNNVAFAVDTSVETATADDKTGKQLQTVAAADYRRMAEAAAGDGIDLMLCSGSRSVEYQQKLFDAEVEEWKAKGLSDEEATEKAATVVAVPGHSEHNTGLAADIVTPDYQRLDTGFEETDAFAWLNTHAAEYGFVLRYPRDKTAITGIIYEPWHYRYVGVENAQAISESGLCLEEYLAKMDVESNNSASGEVVADAGNA